uniref:E3 ubiquitin-protein ligase RGLG2 n=1 Tax=Rhizophora mucronata TaxID=61149 RepID=A0A2P2ILR5_RHIMU
MEIMSKNMDTSRKETEFALTALMEIPSQYKATIELHLLGHRKGGIPQRVPLPPPLSCVPSFSSPKLHLSASYAPSVPSYRDSQPASSAPLATSSDYDNQLCPICLSNKKDMAFGCGHQTCCDCGESLQLCPICRSTIQTRIKLY